MQTNYLSKPKRVPPLLAYKTKIIPAVHDANTTQGYINDHNLLGFRDGTFTTLPVK